jgi:hypothetical protein
VRQLKKATNKTTRRNAADTAANGDGQFPFVAEHFFV